MIQKIAKELASEFVLQLKYPTYKPMLDRNECIKKLCTIYDEEFSYMSEKFDHYVEKYKKSPDVLSS